MPPAYFNCGDAAQDKERGVCRCQRWSREIYSAKKEIHHHQRTMLCEPRSFDHQYNSAEKHYAEAKQVLQAAEIRQAEYKLANQDIKQIELNRITKVSRLQRVDIKPTTLALPKSPQEPFPMFQTNPPSLPEIPRNTKRAKLHNG
jgi:hypothetical protein